MTNSLFLEYTENIHMDVICVERTKDYILAGIGNTLFVYQNQSLETSIPIFLNERIHGLQSYANYILAKGGKQLAVINLEKVGEKINCGCISEIQCSDWVQDVTIFNENLLGLTTAHNMFELWNLKSKERIDFRSCSEKCILYSCKIVGNSAENVVIFSGTVLGEVILWNPFAAEEKNILKRFEAHSGAVFSIEINLKEKVLCTTSDDRSLKIWSVDTSGSLIQAQGWRCANIKLMHTLFGHTARVWKSLIISDFYVSIGEDSQLVVWRRNGSILKKLSLHQEGGIRALTFSKENNEIFTGGEDGGLNMISWKSLISECQSPGDGKIINADKNFSTKVCFTKNGFVYTTNGGCKFVNGTQEEFIYQSEDFLSYCVIEGSPSGEYIALGSIKGHLVIIDGDNNRVLTKGQYLNGRVYSIHWLNDHILTCGSNGLLNLWRLAKNTLTGSKTYILPSCKERWSTCAVIHNHKMVVGDRMGNIHVYDTDGGNMPLQTYTKIHSYLGVTDMIIDDKNVLSIGRDGTLKNFSEDLSLLCTNKLPMDWPWKIVNYKNDKLIVGFHSVNLIVWSLKLREVIASQDCGGGHRSCHISLDGDNLKFLYVKEKKAFQIDLPLIGITRLRIGFHSKEINALKMIQTEPPIFITGSEDTTLRISRLTHSDIEPMHVLKTHTSSVRSVTICPLNAEEVFVVSAGGKAQMILWKFNLKYNICQELVNHRLKKEDRNWKWPAPTLEPDIRFMCTDLLKNENGLLIAAGCSDCRIRLFSFNESLNLLSTIMYTNCILKVSVFEMNQKIYVMSLGTDGKVVFWRLKPENWSAVQCGEASLHQSGINSFAFKNMESGECILVTGGDDNKIVVSLVEFSENNIKISQIWSNSNVHSCQITGAIIIQNYLITASIDQRITLWKWNYDERGFEIQYEDQRLISVPDVQGLDGKLCSDNSILTIVYGKGIETLKIDCKNEKNTNNEF